MSIKQNDTVVAIKSIRDVYGWFVIPKGASGTVVSIQSKGNKFRVRFENPNIVTGVNERSIEIIR